MKTMRILMVLLLMLPTMAASANEDAAAMAANVCAACHGKDGNTPIAGSPKLAGQYYRYLVQTLKEYRSGARENAIMQQQAAELTDAEIDALAAYYSALPGDLR